MFIFFFLIIFLTQCQEHEPRYYPSEIKKGYIPFDHKNPLSAQYIYQRNQEIAEASKKIAQRDLSNQIFNSLAQHYIDQPFHYYKLWNDMAKKALPPVMHEAMLRNLYSIASIIPYSSFQKQFKCHNKLRFIEQQSREKVYDYKFWYMSKFNLDSQYISIQSQDNDKNEHYLDVYSTAQGHPTLLNKYSLGPCLFDSENPYQTFLNATNTLIKTSSGICMYSINNQQCSLMSDISKPLPLYLCQKRPSLFFLLEKNRLIKGELSKSNTVFTLENDYEDFAVFEQSDDSCIIELSRTDEYAVCYQYDYVNNTLTKIDALNRLAQKFTHIEDRNDHYYVSTINIASFKRKKHVSGLVSKGTNDIVASCIDNKTDDGYAYASVGHLNGFLSGYATNVSNKETMYGIMLRFPLAKPFSDQSRFEEFKYAIGNDKFIQGIYKTEFPATYLIAYSFYDRINFEVLHFPLVEDYLTFQSLTDDQKRIKIKYEKRMYHLKQWFNYFYKK